jgi:hypothetical protein
MKYVPRGVGVDGLPTMGVSSPILEAIGSGIWAAIQHEIAHGREAELPEKTPEITRIALAPLGGRAFEACGG